MIAKLASSSGAEKLAELKSEFFRAENKPQRVARALDALRRAKRASKLDPPALKFIAQHADLQDD